MHGSATQATLNVRIMELIFHGAVFLGCALILYVSGEWVVHGLMRLSRVLHVREFVVAFFVMATAASLPNLFVGITSAMAGIPELSLGDVFGNNLIAMTLAISAGVFFTRRHSIAVHSETVRTSMLFMAVSAVFPVLLLTDGQLGRVDGVLLIGLFLFYVRWLLSQHERFSKKYNGLHMHSQKEFLKHARLAVKDTAKVAAGVSLLVIAAYGIVSSASFFAAYFELPLLLIGLLIVGLGNALPEVYFSIASAGRGDTALIMGNLVGAVIVPATLILGIVALISPIYVDGLEFLTGSRVFLLVSAALFFLFATTRRRIGPFEAGLLTLLYIAFVVWTVLAAS